MNIYVQSNSVPPESITQVLNDGHTLALYSVDMTDEEIFNAVLDCDVVVVDTDGSFLSGFVTGIGVAMGRTIYQVSPTGESVSALEGVFNAARVQDAISEALACEKVEEDD